jgi:hypothetical protein
MALALAAGLIALVLALIIIEARSVSTDSEQTELTSDTPLKVVDVAQDFGKGSPVLIANQDPQTQERLRAIADGSAWPGNDWCRQASAIAAIDTVWEISLFNGSSEQVDVVDMQVVHELQAPGVPRIATLIARESEGSDEKVSLYVRPDFREPRF